MYATSFHLWIMVMGLLKGWDEDLKWDEGMYQK